MAPVRRAWRPRSHRSPRHPCGPRRIRRSTPRRSGQPTRTRLDGRVRASRMQCLSLLLHRHPQDICARLAHAFARCAGHLAHMGRTRMARRAPRRGWRPCLRSGRIDAPLPWHRSRRGRTLPAHRRAPHEGIMVLLRHRWRTWPRRLPPPRCARRLLGLPIRQLLPRRKVRRRTSNGRRLRVAPRPQLHARRAPCRYRHPLPARWFLATRHPAPCAPLRRPLRLRLRSPPPQSFPVRRLPGPSDAAPRLRRRIFRPPRHPRIRAHGTRPSW